MSNRRFHTCVDDIASRVASDHAGPRERKADFGLASHVCVAVSALAYRAPDF